jgi:hypothetical protein
MPWMHLAMHPTNPECTTIGSIVSTVSGWLEMLLSSTVIPTVIPWLYHACIPACRQGAIST